jgi:hypothetical protein
MAKKFIKGYRVFFCAAALLVCARARGASFSPGLFNGNVTAEERVKLSSGDVLIRNIGKAKNISLNPVNPTAKKAITVIQSLNPSYLAEVIQVRPYKEEERVIDRMRDILLDVPSYKGIPYWSVTHQRWFELYSSAVVRSRQTQDAATVISAELVMDPFTPIDAEITVAVEDASLFYFMENKNNLKTSGITAVKENCMNSIIIVFRDGDFLVLYGIGGVKAPAVLFLKERLERSFMNRIKTFCMFVYEKL